MTITLSDLALFPFGGHPLFDAVYTYRELWASAVTAERLAAADIFYSPKGCKHIVRAAGENKEAAVAAIIAQNRAHAGFISR